MKVIEFPTKEAVEDRAIKLADTVGELCDDAMQNGVPVYFIISFLEQLKTAIVLGTIEETDD